MKTDKYFLMSLLLALLAIAPVTLRADGMNKQEVLTFSQAVEVPGAVLPAGSYIFKMLEPPIGDHIVRVLSEDGRHVIATFFAVPDYRLNPDSKIEVTFEERGPGMPPSIRTWFYPGELIGEEFIYSKMKAVAVADNSNVAPSEPSSTASEMTPPAAEPSADMSNSAPVQAPQIADVQEPTPAPAAPDVATTPADTASAGQPTELPKTASPISSLTFIGLIALGAAGIGKLFGPA